VSGGPDERVTRSEAVRDANDEIRDAAKRHDVNERVPFLCECVDPRCTEIIRLSLTEYDEVRAEPTGFVVAPGHLPFSREI
jgi:hypothetical protein